MYIKSKTIFVIYKIKYIYRKNNFAEKSKILLDTDLKIIFLDYQNFTLNLKNN